VPLSSQVARILLKKKLSGKDYLQKEPDMAQKKISINLPKSGPPNLTESLTLNLVTKKIEATMHASRFLKKSLSVKEIVLKQLCWFQPIIITKTVF
jgi:hypothetical protein